MCGRYYVDDEMAREISELVNQIDDRLKQERLGRDIHPSEAAPVIKREGKELLTAWQRWGLPGFQKSSLIFNARSETVLEKKMFREGIRHRRVVVPCTWFYEWNRNKEKITFLREDGGVMLLAGFYNPYEDGDHFVILTTDANESMKSTHPRMPLILEKGEPERWIYEDEAVEEMLEKRPIGLKKRAEYEQQTFLF